jgi:hypothetical protein
VPDPVKVDRQMDIHLAAIFRLAIARHGKPASHEANDNYGDDCYRQDPIDFHVPAPE